MEFSAKGQSIDIVLSFVMCSYISIFLLDAMSSQHLGSNAFSPSDLGNRTGWNM